MRVRGELVSNQHAPFTRWVVSEGWLHEALVVIDVGVQAGENPRWNALGDHLILHGFDPLEAVVEGLRKANTRPNVVYHCAALGNEDGYRTLFVNENDLLSSSFYEPGESRAERRAPSSKPRQVAIRRLDSLAAAGIIPRPDAIKIDVEGFELDVLAGATQYLDGVKLLELETNFSTSSIYPRTHFAAMNEVALANQLLLFDIEFCRTPTSTYQNALEHKGLPRIADHFSIGRPSTVNALFARDIIQEHDYPELYTKVARSIGYDDLLKQIVMFELYGLNDIAIDIFVRFAEYLGSTIDVAKAIDLLGDPYCRIPGDRVSVEARLAYQTAEQAAFVQRINELIQEKEQFHAAHDTAVTRLRAEMDAERRAYIGEIERLRVAQQQPIYKLAIASAVRRVPPGLRRKLRSIAGEKVSQLLISRLLG